MTALRLKSSWKQHETMTGVMNNTADSPTRVDEPQAMEARAWNHKLRHGDNCNSQTRKAEHPSAAKDALVVDASHKKHRFSLRRLFKHEHNDKKVFAPPVPIPSDFLTKEKHGGVTVSGKRIPFTRDAHKRRRKAVKPMPRINEDRMLGPMSSSKSMDDITQSYYLMRYEAKAQRMQ
ncbi:hypothetical protein BBO99_00005246 [Phytophthora kernoviae]|uniref:Uncharacterized protein n=2 Tax=Phytophthora kernoviae TaxID=325452 RepID=A0A3R7NFR3_9STRA|nr:hypothetical protein G195_005773 [Phytophthora kernoviae 00238/432]KAG2526187.1 hypothetical protein JM18_004509 [Phytophthora kernoviae]KAG2526875.1 hypothetical protein JM16_003648 [Phytophthora kernoviae]RLN45826.1 hypothetical protein BBI17_005365 [Phytophthora kernoviae]RLN79462.1 hypothetical protein BBO99_00005246 [Phytophthora kernoviae]